MSDEIVHCYGAHNTCNGPGLCHCDCPDCEALTPQYRPLWCRIHPGKRHMHRGVAGTEVMTWHCVDA